MTSVKCIYADGSIVNVKTSKTFEEVKEYYEGFTFNIGILTDNLQKCVRVELDEEG